uniref:Uncharacterized protein n=1 Tax=viral metagenome TaxID=1070528 RepID=A0A6C0L3R4_9ZZZZ
MEEIKRHQAAINDQMKSGLQLTAKDGKGELQALVNHIIQNKDWIDQFDNARGPERKEWILAKMLEYMGPERKNQWAEEWMYVASKLQEISSNEWLHKLAKERPEDKAARRSAAFLTRKRMP